jgi:hypothetical protein
LNRPPILDSSENQIRRNIECEPEFPEGSIER